MICPKCSAVLAESQEKCPLCGTRVAPTEKKEEIPYYPSCPRPRDRVEIKGLLFFFTVLFLAAGGSLLALDLCIGNGVSFSPYCLFGLGFVYAAFFFPRWFSHPNPVIFFPISYWIALSFLLYLCLDTGGRWFWIFALPVGAGIFVGLETAVVLTRYLRHGKLYVYASVFLLFAVLSFVGEILFWVSRGESVHLSYSLIPLILFGSLGIWLMVIAIVRPLRRYFERRFFV